MKKFLTVIFCVVCLAFTCAAAACNSTTDGNDAGTPPKEEADSNARPPVKDPLTAQTVSGYDAIIVMYPIWWHTAPMVVGTFLESYDLSGVDVYPITQSASMSASQFNESFAFIESCANNATVRDGLGTKSTYAIDSYLRANGLIA